MAGEIKQYQILHFLQGAGNTLNSSNKTKFINQGWIYFTPDTGYLYIDLLDESTRDADNTVPVVANSTSENASANRIRIATELSDHVKNLLTVQGMAATDYEYDGSDPITLSFGNAKLYAGSSTTAAATEIKDVTCNSNTYALTKGTVLFATFSNTNTAAVANLKLRVNSSTSGDAKPIKCWINGSLSNLPSVGSINKDHIYEFYYDGTNWVMMLPDDTKNTAGSTDNSGKLYLIGAGSQGTNPQTYSHSSVFMEAGALTADTVANAVWNDYAEYRKTLPEVKYGQVVVDNDDGSLSIANKRLMPGGQVVSDTWGHIMGETPDAKTPLAVAGRVLVYPYQDRKKYHAGQAVCTAPNGTVDIMSRREIKKYPDRIIGIVSEIPEYEYWGSGHVKVDGRIWIKIR